MRPLAEPVGSPEQYLQKKIRLTFIKHYFDYLIISTLFDLNLAKKKVPYLFISIENNGIEAGWGIFAWKRLVERTHLLKPYTS